MNNPVSERRSMINKNHKSLSISHQCRILNIHRSGLYYVSTGESQENLRIMEEIDKQYLKTPFYGARRMAAHLKRLGYKVGRKRLRRLYRIMQIEAIYSKPNLSKPGKGHKIYPYLLRRLKIDYPNQVWATDITYIPMPNGFMYLMAVIDLYSRKVLSWGISNTMDTAFCLEVVNLAVERYGKPEIFNTDQGSQFTSNEFTQYLLGQKIKVSMDGKGRATDNAFIERLWREVKEEYLYLNRPEDGEELHKGLTAHFEYHNQQRPHQSLKYRFPDEYYCATA